MDHSHTNTGGNDHNIVDHNEDHADQRTDAGLLCRIGLLILPDQEQDQTNQRNTAAQKGPSDVTVVYHSRLILLGYAACRAYYSLIIDFFSAIFTKRHS